jgi:hypothetical protein
VQGPGQKAQGKKLMAEDARLKAKEDKIIA